MNSIKQTLSVFLALASLHAFAAPLALNGPNDPFYPQQWALKNDGSQIVRLEPDGLHTTIQKGVAGVDIGWEKAQAELAQLPSTEVVVAVIDFGMDITHPELVDKVWTNPTPGAKDLHGWNFLQNNATVSDDEGHGTHVGGIIIAAANNGAGIAGVAGSATSKVKVMPLRVLSKDFKTFKYPDSAGNLHPISDYVGAAVHYAIDHGAKIINMSLGWPKAVDNTYARDAVREAVQKGILVIAAAGNNHKDQPTYPCSYEGVLCVGAITNTGAVSKYSNFGSHVDVLAPGDDVISTFPIALQSPILRLQGFEQMSGSSQAAPMVTGIAALLKSAHPEYTVNDLKARLFSTAGAIPSENAALFGLVNLSKSLNAASAPVFYPNFKSLNGVSIDEATLKASGTLSINNFWTEAKNVTATIMINHQNAGQASIASLGNGASFPVSWSYQFGSLDESSTLEMRVNVRDSEGHSRDFFSSFAANRIANQIANQKVISVTETDNGRPVNWVAVGGAFGLTRVIQYGNFQGTPIYYQAGLGPDKALIMELVQPRLGQDLNPDSHTQVVKTITVPFIDTVLNVLKIDLEQNGKQDWVILGTGLKNKEKFLQFYLLGPDFEPLNGSMAGSSWQISLDSKVESAILHGYSGVGSWATVRNTLVYPPAASLIPSFIGMNSWIKMNGKLVPSFIAKSTLPGKENFDSLDMRHYQSDNHLFYLAPDSKPSSTGEIPLTLHALDNAQFRAPFSEYHIQGNAPSSPEEQKAGHIRVFTLLGHELDSEIKVWDIPSIEKNELKTAPGWDLLSESGVPYRLPNANLSSTGAQSSYVFLNSFDGARQALNWSNSGAQFMGHTEFSYQKLLDPISSFTAAFDLGSRGRFWFLQSNYDLVGYFESSPGTKTESHSVSVERDSSFTNDMLTTLINPVVVGSTRSPKPGLYLDFTTIRGDEVAIAVFDPDLHTFEKPLRYSFHIPTECVQVNPVQVNEQVESFTVPLVCKENGATNFRYIFPN